MISIDTNIAVRAIIGDDPAQTASARQLIEKGVWISLTVILEIDWVLKSYYRLVAAERAEYISGFLLNRKITAEDKACLFWAIERMRDGADFADMIHIVASRGKDAFVSFEKRLDQFAGADCPVPILRPENV